MWSPHQKKIDRINKKLERVGQLQSMTHPMPKTMKFRVWAEDGTEQEIPIDFSVQFGAEAAFTPLANNGGFLRGISQIPGEISMVWHTNSEYIQSGFHRHPHAEIFTVVDGQTTMQTKKPDGQITEWHLSQGDTIIVPAKTLHNHVNISKQSCTAIKIWSYYQHYHYPQWIHQSI